MACGNRQASDLNDAGLRGCHATDVKELYVDGSGIRLDVVTRAVGLLKISVVYYVGYCMLNRGKLWRVRPQNCIIE